MRKTFQIISRSKKVAKPKKSTLDNSGHDLTIQNFYSSNLILPQAQSPELLSGWLSKHHPRYNMSSWCFFGNITDENGKTAAINSIIQYQSLPDNLPYIAEWSYCDDQTDGYVLAPFLLEEGNVEYASPFAITADYNPINTGILSLSLIYGEMGKRWSKYRMSGRVFSEPDGNLWEYELLLEDTFGVMQTGYGPSSFLPQWLFPDQTKVINSEFQGDIHKYLQSGKDDMLGQGSYYYSMPLLKVENFNITKNGNPYSSGKRGNIWVDYVVQSFGEESLKIVGSATWQFFAIQFPVLENYYNYQAAMMISIVEATVQSDPKETSDLKAARFYISDPYHVQYNENGSMISSFDWTFDQITYTVTKDADGYPTKFSIQLIAPKGKVELSGEAIRKNQMIKVVEKYEGVFKVTANISFENGIEQPGAEGFAWAEIH
ncbi:hypothetical protein [Leptospira sarikeiensis]|uniref:AttH domain-containing protein n=1 Tax=Leptospira sarikeiensis TaxID=2484943 RepID=A0A4R9K745_9LEPT|nr:hypothetical protein [Leptospira sarikeiensis]TGL60475.1 hypothetical protein EHQ64_11585 [Leptospira sarikeiensis]